ncbi:xylulokinase [Guptibacillus hwajinpoensis]|uniref:xylulokinase n=1 Tax=Guptibacillus hwajinpoensis TaxID=208199 RepID=UPI001CFCFB0F|nr:xylulokinase [Pseudalkalibacillus hwajinpoensis]WLR60191.1 xylulokinase [Pseudalkalibacillus hwajinpoensis]
MSYVIGVDLGTSAVKVIAVDRTGEVQAEVSKTYPLHQPKSGYSEQNPDDWVEQTLHALEEITRTLPSSAIIEGMSFSGQMHGLVLLDQDNKPLRQAILWNDTRTTEQCRTIEKLVGKKRLLEITHNPALEGFTLPKLLWVKENEPDLYARTKVFLLPKDYVRYRLTGELQMEYSDAAGTLMMDISGQKWSEEVTSKTNISLSLCPPLIESTAKVGNITKGLVKGLDNVEIFAGGADNACGAIGAGILRNGKTLCSIGTSGVILSYEDRNQLDFDGKVHFFNHSKPGAYYTMGVTLSAGQSLNWFRDQFAEGVPFDELLSSIDNIPAGANGLLFTPYLAGERTPHADSSIRGSFIGMDASHTRTHFVKAVLEGITFSLKESLSIFRENGKDIHEIVSIGGGAKNDSWLQMQADIFDATVVKHESEEGPALGAAMLAAVGCNWFPTLESCSDSFIKVKERFTPNQANVKAYKKMFSIYQSVYVQTKELSEQLKSIRQ